MEIASLKYLLSHVLETKGLHEMLFPDSEQPFVMHQAVEIANHLNLFGPVKSLMCFSGERTMKAIGDGVPDGGQKYIISVAKRYVAKENAATSDKESYVKSKDFYTDNDGFYSGKVLKLTKRFTKVCLNFEIKDMLLNSMQEFLATQEIFNLVVKSPFVRLYFTYESLYKSYNESSWRDFPESFPATFAQWIHHLHQLRCSSFEFSSDTAQALVKSVVFDEDISLNWRSMGPDDRDTVGTMLMSTMVDRGFIFMSDLDGIVKELACFATIDQPIAAFTHAVIKGISFCARGANFAEDKLLLEDTSGTNRVGLGNRYLIQNQDNNLNTNWYSTFQFNSWCRITDYYVHYTSRLVKQAKKRSYLGQFNYFFRLSLPSDSILDGTAFANTVLRQADYSPIHGCYSIKNLSDDTSYYALKQFVPLSYVDSTALAVVAMDAQDLPMMSPDATLRRAKDPIQSYPLTFSTAHYSDVDRLDFIELHKDRTHLQYKSVEDDIEKTKTFESCILKHHGR